MPVTLLPALRRNLVLFAFAFVAAALAFGTIMLTSPPTTEAAVSEPGAIPSITVCEYLPTGDVASCTVRN